MREIDKARRYEATHPGIEIPIEQKAERFDRVQVKKKYSDSVRGYEPKGRRRTVGRITLDGLGQSAWCSCGRLNGHEGDC